jgi:hypothetical protein
MSISRQDLGPSDAWPPCREGSNGSEASSQRLIRPFGSAPSARVLSAAQPRARWPQGEAAAGAKMVP